MNYSNEIMEILNKDEKARKMIQSFRELAAAENFTKEEYEEHHQIAMGLIIYQNKEAMRLMAREVYEEINAQ